MTERTPPAWLQSGSYPAEDDRRLLASLSHDAEGVVLSADLAVTQRGAGANMSVDVAGGRAFIKGDLSTYEGTYFMENRGTTNLSISASDPTNPRRDLIIAEVLNAEYSGVSNLWRLRVVTGTPAASPVLPSVPNNAIGLANVLVGAAVTSITNANITDLRTLVVGKTPLIICTSGTRPSLPYEGLKIYETDTDSEYTYTGSTWIMTASLAAWPTWTPTLTQTGAVTKTLNEVSYEKIGRRVSGTTHMTVTGAGTGGTAITVGLPITAKAFSGTPIIGDFWCYDASAGTGYHGALVLVSTTTAVGWASGQTGNIGVTPNFALANTDQVGYSFTYQSAS